MDSRSFLLRRPRPPNSSSRPLLPPISGHSSPLQKSPDLRRLSTANQDGLQSPVPTMHSDFVLRRKDTNEANCWVVGLQDDEADDVRGDTTDANMKGVIAPYKPRGPDPFPVREPRRPCDVAREYILPDDSYYCNEPQFRLEDFLVGSKSSIPLRHSFRKTFLSRANYKKLTRLFQFTNKDPSKPVLMTQVNIDAQNEIEPKPRRVPRAQVLLEMKKVVQDRLEDLGLTSPSRLGTSERLDEVLDEIQELGDASGVGLKSQMLIFTKATEKVFQDGRIPGFGNDDDTPDSYITPAELAVLNCLMAGGFVLSLKAHFISHLPDLKPLSRSLVYLNLSFNEFVVFPREVLSCRDLHVLKLRDNPLVEIPSDISRLTNLRTLIVSFCCLTSLPMSLFSLTSLEFLDVSYNKLTFLPNEMRRLENLRFFNMEGNELIGLPCGMLRLNLFKVRVRNNFMHPLLWLENCINSPQPLMDLCALKLQKEFINGNPENYSKLPEKVADILRNHSHCDCCGGHLYGHGLRILRPCAQIWGVRKMPFIFNSCSSQCYSSFIHNTDPKLVQVIYGIESANDLCESRS